MLRGGGLDHGAELPLAESLVAGEIDLPHRGLCALRYGVDEIDAAVAAVDDLRLDADLVAADMPVGLDDAADVGLHRGALQRAARLGFDRRREVGVLDLLVAFERDAVEHGRFGQMHDQPFAGAIDRNLVEQAGCDQRLQCRVARGVVEPSIGRGVKIATARSRRRRGGYPRR